MQIIIDTNVLLASLRSSSGASHVIAQLLDQHRVTPVISVPLMFEYEEVLHRSAALPHISSHDIDTFLDYFASLAVEQRIFYLWRPLLVDRDDDMLLELAVAANADYLVTQNVRDFLPGSAAFGLRVVTPGEFLRAFRAAHPL